MNLYKVTGRSAWNAYERRYIIASNQRTAIAKFTTTVTDYFTASIECDFMCKRDNIIPTVEPRKEFEHGKS